MVNKKKWITIVVFIIINCSNVFSQAGMPDYIGYCENEKDWEYNCQKWERTKSYGRVYELEGTCANYILTVLQQTGRGPKKGDVWAFDYGNFVGIVWFMGMENGKWVYRTFSFAY
jgi:hypothetical protein